ncbi:MAG: hypothetical protein ABIV39_19790 [Verrucomicrobiota bacterium]
MASEPSFYQLFRRSRYTRTAMDAGTPGSEGRNQTEVFAVAALGFLLRHDPKFFEFFLCTVCGMSDIPVGKYKIICQDGHKSDLAIVWSGKRVIVIETKIGAMLDDHQNPTLPQFLSAPNGYGLQINRNYKTEGERYYVVLSKDAAINQASRCSAPKFLGFRQWGGLGKMANPSELVSDFLDSLGCLGIPELQLRSLKSMMNLQDGTASAARIFTLLEGLSKYFQLSYRKRKEEEEKWDVQINADRQHFGINIPSQGRFKQWSQCVGSSAKTIGWFGYESAMNEKPRLSIWFYPEKGTLKKVEEFVFSRLGKKCTLHDDVCYISRSPESTVDDVTWFESYLDKLAD